MKTFYRLLNFLIRKNKECSCCAEKIQGKKLIFISRIQRDGSGTTPVTDTKYMDDECFVVRCLSITNGTYIACSFNSFVVKKKNETKERQF